MLGQFLRLTLQRVNRDSHLFTKRNVGKSLCVQVYTGIYLRAGRGGHFVQAAGRLSKKAAIPSDDSVPAQTSAKAVTDASTCA